MSFAEQPHPFDPDEYDLGRCFLCGAGEADRRHATGQEPDVLGALLVELHRAKRYDEADALRTLMNERDALWRELRERGP